MTNLANGASVDVLVNDRGPFVSGRIIDLSWDAANAIEIVGPGTGLVKIQVLSVPGGGGKGGESYAVQVASFSSYAQALRFKKRELSRYSYVRIQKARLESRPLYRVQVGSFSSPDRARLFARQIKSVLGNAFVVQND